MGKEARVIAEIGEWYGEGRLQLETDELLFRGAKRLSIPLTGITSLAVEDGWVSVQHADGTARFDLGDFAEKWVHAIRNPRTLLDKLGVTPASHVALIGVPAAFAEEVRARAATVADNPCAGMAFDIIMVAADDPAVLERIPALRAHMKSTGAIWVFHPRGRADLSHDAIMAHGRQAGLIDVKSARFSETHGALKLMLPRAAR